MALVDLRVELSAYSHSFQIQVPQHSTVLNVKQEIRVKCPGAPREDGQRLIWRGRFLRDDEKVIEIWTVCHSNLPSACLLIFLCNSHPMIRASSISLSILLLGHRSPRLSPALSQLRHHTQLNDMCPNNNITTPLLPLLLHLSL